MNKFKTLGLSDKFSKNLENLNITNPTEIQEKAIPVAMQGKDIIGGSATGSGKTIAFAAPIIEHIEQEGIQALILTPTRELAEQICKSIKQISNDFPVNVLSIYGGVDIKRQMRNIPKANIIVGTPGRILDHLNRKTLNLSDVKYLVLDEVDRMFEMGFQEDVEKIISYCPKQRQTLMFSATISRDIDYLSKKHSNNAKEIIVKSQIDPLKLKQVFYDIARNKKFPLLVSLLNKEKSEIVMVFCNTRMNSDFVADNLKLNNINAQAIHGGFSQNKRNKALESFHKGHVNVLVCTDVAARGLDIKDVSHVYNYDIPDNITDYTHRIGRTARVGKEGIAINLVCDRDYDNFRKIEGDIYNIEKTALPDIPRVEMKIPERGKSKQKSRFNSGRGSRGSRKSRDNRSRSGRDSRSSRNNRGGSKGLRDRSKRSSSRDNRDSKPGRFRHNSHNRKRTSRTRR
ncbi:MAG: DEAD/DEAH box helicase [Candidatus Nanoarchaeia archaeon]